MRVDTPFCDPTEARYKAGAIGLDDLLKMKLQLLQFQTDVSQARLARVQGLSDLRQLLGYEQVSAEYDVAGSFDYQPMKGGDPLAAIMSFVVGDQLVIRGDRAHSDRRTLAEAFIESRLCAIVRITPSEHRKVPGISGMTTN